MAYPTNAKEIQPLLGMVNYMSKFIPNLSSHTYNLCKLLDKDSTWCFKNSQRAEVDYLKKLVSTSPILKFVNPELPS